MDHYTPYGSGNDQQAPSEELPDDLDMNLDQGSQQDEKQARLDYVKSVVPPPKPKQKWPIIVLVVVVVLLLAGGGYFFFKQHKANKTTKQHKTTMSQVVVPSSTSTSSSTTHYVSNGNDLNLDFDYPSTWSVTPASNDNPNDTTITLSSPLVKITNDSNTSVTGKVVVTIRPGTAQLSELSSGESTTGQASVQIAYAKPTSDQYQYPYLTFIHLPPGNDADSAFEEALISGNTPFAKGQSITESSVSVDPIIAASFYSCTTDACTGSGATPLSITNDTWQNDAVFQQTLAIFESMQLN